MRRRAVHPHSVMAVLLDDATALRNHWKREHGDLGTVYECEATTSLIRRVLDEADDVEQEPCPLWG